MLDSLLHYDQELFLYLNGLGSETWDSFWLIVTYKWNSIPLYILLLYVAYRNCNGREFILLLVTIALLITFTDQFTNLTKNTFQRLRPCYDPAIANLARLVKEACGYRYGYVSAHSTNSFGLAFFFSYLFGKGKKSLIPLLFVWASLVSYSRIYVGVHYPLDVLSGAILGILIGWVFGKAFLLIKQKYRL